LSKIVGSTTRRLYFHPFGPTKLIDDASLSIALMVAVIVLCTTPMPPGRVDCPILEPWTSAATGASPGGFSLAVTVLLYVTVTLSPTLSSSKRFAFLVDRLELAIVSLDVDDPLVKIDTLYRARKSDGLGLLSDLGPARQRRS
jgi:hypothetical protein